MGNEPSTAVSGGTSAEFVPFKRLLFAPGIVLNAAELLLVALPLWALFSMGDLGRSVLLRAIIPIAAGAVAIWLLAQAIWLLPVQRAVLKRRRGERLGSELSARVYRATWKIPLRMLYLRTALWMGAAFIFGTLMARYGHWDQGRAAQLAALASLHAFLIAGARAAWMATVLQSVRDRLFPSVMPLERFRDGYFRRLLLTAMVVAGGAASANAAFLYYFLPITHEQYLQVQSFIPVALAVGVVVWIALAYRSTRNLRRYLRGTATTSGTTSSTSSGTKASGDAEPQVVEVYRSVQSLPYRLAARTLLVWSAVIGTASFIARTEFRFEFDDAILMFGVAMTISVGAAIYEALWHRETVRPLLVHLTLRHRLPIRGIRPSLSLRTKLLLSLGSVVVLACGLALFWGFIQYKSLVTDFVSKQADLGLAWLRSEVRAAAASGAAEPTSELVEDTLRGINTRSPEANAVFYYLPSGKTGMPVALGGGPMGAPRLPWYVALQMQRPYDDSIDVRAAALSGRHGRLVVAWHGRAFDLGSVAVFYPNYRGRGESMVRPLKELMVFFLVLFGACAGIIIFTVAQFVAPIRKLEQRADGMARGELSDPVSAGGEGDEVGRLTFALEEMRRALRDKLRSTEEVNLDLERAVQRRTADLARKNRELAETLDKLTRTQAQLVRSEKMASIGQLVAGIAHEINNPVNAIVNSVGPLEESIDRINDGSATEQQETAEDIRDMLRVVQRGAQRTKAIVSALHNYSRTDDESVVEFEINRSLDDSLELLRHLLKQNIEVERHYGEVGRMRGHAGQLNQVFMNLLTNAAQAVAGKDGAKISLETRMVPEGALIAIRDNGPGISSTVLPRIFDPFFTTKDVGEGTGLGLSIVHELVTRHGGTIEVDSEPGTGTTFTVVLPKGTESIPA